MVALAPCGVGWPARFAAAIRSPPLTPIPIKKPLIVKTIVAPLRSCPVDVSRIVGEGCLILLVVLGIATRPAPLGAADLRGFCLGDHSLMTVTLFMGNGMADRSLSFMKSC